MRDFDEDVIKEAARRANNAIVHGLLPSGSSLSAVGTDPGKPQAYYDLTMHSREIDTDRKMRAITRFAATYMEIVISYIGFERDPSAPNYQHPPESFCRLLVHTAIEDCHPKKGAELFRWLSDDDVGVPDASTLYRYAEKFDVGEHAERFLEATCTLLGRIGLTPSEPVHLGFDITKVSWYGDVETDEEGAPTDEEWLIKSENKNNTTWFWAVGVLSITAPDRNYVLGFEPISDQKAYDQALDTMLDRYNLLPDRPDLAVDFTGWPGFGEIGDEDTPDDEREQPGAVEGTKTRRTTNANSPVPSKGRSPAETTRTRGSSPRSRSWEHRCR